MNRGQPWRNALRPPPPRPHHSGSWRTVADQAYSVRMGPHDGSRDGPRAAAPDWPDKAAADMTDGELLAYAKQVYRRFKEVRRDAPENDGLLRRWGAVCGEMTRRGMTDVVAEGRRPRDVVSLAREPDSSEGKRS
jgi:hypothetical protein